MRFFNKVKGTLDMATRKSQDAIEANKMNTQLKKLEGDADRLYQSIGEKVFRDPTLEQPETQNHIQAQVHALKHLHRQMNDLKIKILLLKDLIECDSCGKVHAVTIKFCPDCGNNIADLVKRTMKNMAIEDQKE